MAEPQIDISWRTTEFRQKCVAQIDEAMRTCPNPNKSKTGTELEQQVFQKTGNCSREDYLLLVSKLICHFRMVNITSLSNFNGNNVAMFLNRAGINAQQDPALALKTIVSVLIQHAQSQAPHTTVPHGGPGGPGGVVNPQMMAMNRAQRPVGPDFVGGAGGGGGGGGQPGVGYQQIPRRPMMTAQNEMFMLQQRQPGAVIGPGGQNPIIIAPNNQINGAGMSGMNPQQFHQMMAQRQANPAVQGVVGGGMGVGVGGGVGPVGIMPTGQPGMNFNPMGGVGAGVPIGSMSSPAGGVNLGGHLGMGGQGMSGIGPGGKMIPSPGTMMPSHSPGPPHGAVGPNRSLSPHGANMRPIPGALSPGGVVNININTPGNPSSVGANSADDQEYLEKWKSLQKYIEPLKRMINRIDKDEDRKMDLVKMKNLLDILSDSTKRLPISTLNKCEHVLEKQLSITKTPFSTSSSSAAPVGGGILHFGQPLFDAISANIKNPMLNHTLQRTFGTAVKALHGSPITSLDGPPAKQQRFEDPDDGFDVPDVIQSEIAQLHHRFIVNLDPKHHCGSKVILLQCQLEDKYLPSLPALIVALPEGYPHATPVLESIPKQYESTAFLKKLKEILLNELDRSSGQYSLTAFLNLWIPKSVNQFLDGISTSFDIM